MKKIIKLLIILLIILAVITIGASRLYTDKIECDNNTIIISVCTGDMRALETGISVYAGYNQVPFILSDKTMPEQLNSWLPQYIKDNNITKIIVVGPVTPQQLIDFMKLNVEVKQVTGNTIPEILTKIADNTEEINRDSVIITSSDPLAGVLGAYTKTPVFITACNGTYSSDTILNEEYIKYIEKHDIKHAIIIGNIPETIKNQLKTKNITIEEISGQNTLEISNNINTKLKNEGYLKNTTRAYYGFYGELPTIIPTIIKENAIMIEDSSNTGNIIQYLKDNSINTVIITRNTESDYIQMEETDYVSNKIITELKNNNITIKYLTKQRTLDEATGLYDMKIMTAEEIQNKTQNNYTNTDYQNIKTQPPLIEMLEKNQVKDSNNISAQITRENNNTTVKWNTIHPYTWKKTDENNYYATSNTGYEYKWTKEDKTWHVEYIYNKTKYYNVTWIENEDKSWTEKQQNKNYTWKYDGTVWKCYNQTNDLIYYISII